MTDALLSRILDSATNDSGHRPHSYQREAAEFMWENPRSAWWADVGMGKCFTSATVMARALMEFDSGKALVIGPIRVIKQTWPTEMQEWYNLRWMDHVIVRAEDEDEDVRAFYDAHRLRYIEAATALGMAPGLRSRWATKYAQARRDEYKKEKRRQLANSLAPVHMIGLPQVEWLVQHHGRNWPYHTVIIDEASAFKEFSTNRWRAMNSVFKYTERMHQLTASPATEGWLQIWSQVGLLDRGERLGRRITHYRETYFTHDPFTYSYDLRPGAQEIISAKISDICLVMKAEDYLDREKPLMLTRPVTLNDHAIKLYDEFVETFVLSLDEQQIEAVHGGALINKLLQFTGGAVLDEEKQLHEIHDDKIEELKELVDELQGEPLIVCYWYKSSLMRLKRAFPKAVVMDRAAKCVDDWNAGKISILLLQPAGAAHGLNMQKGPGHDMAFYDPIWSRELYTQAIGRIDRQGQRRVVRVHHLVVKRADDGVKRSAREREERMTADEIVMAALADKGAGQDALFRYIKALRKKVAAKAVSVVRHGDSDGDDL